MICFGSSRVEQTGKEAQISIKMSEMTEAN